MMQFRPFYLFTIVLFILASFSLFSSVGASQAMWNQTYGGTSNEFVYSLVETVDGGYALAGSTSSFGAGSSDFWLVKINANGDTEWDQTYGGNRPDEAHSLVETSDGGFALVGNTYSFGAGDQDSWLVKTDSSGNVEWNQTYGGGVMDGSHSLVETSDGGFALIGTTFFGFGGYDFWLVKSDASGKMEFSQGYGGTGPDHGYSLVETSDGGFALAGYTQSFGAGLMDFWLVKTDLLGNMEWNQTYGGADNDRTLSLVETSDGGFALAGFTESFGAGGYDFWLIKTDEYGIIPEFPSWIILPLLLIVTIVVLTYRKKLKDRIVF